MPSTSRRALLGFLAGLTGVAGCTGRDPSDPTNTPRTSQSTESTETPTVEPTETPIRTVEATPAGTPASTSTEEGKPTRVTGVSADLSTRTWQVEAGTSSWRRSPPAVAGGHVYVGSREGVAVGLDVANGDRVWRHAFDTPLDLLGPAVADGVCVFGSEEGAVALAVD